MGSEGGRQSGVEGPGLVASAGGSRGSGVGSRGSRASAQRAWETGVAGAGVGTGGCEWGLEAGCGVARASRESGVGSWDENS